MQVAKLHADEFDIDELLVRRLLRSQALGSADLPLRLVEPIGTDNVMLRLGENLGVRLPRIPRAAGGIAIEQDIVPRLASYRLAAVIDWGGLSLGDPALDLMPAWNLLTAPTRATFREHAEVDDPTWNRARAWSFSIAMVALAYYYRTDSSQIVDLSRHALDQVIAEL